MTYEEWAEIYKPKPNHLVKGEDQLHFETYGIELGYVLATADIEPDRVWTLVDGDEGTWIVNGYHLVNRISYFITEVPYLGDGIEILDELYSTEEEEADELLTDTVYQLMKQHKNEILDSGDWWWSIEGYDINVHCADDENFEDPSAVFNINLYRLDLGDTSSYTKDVQHDLEPMTRQEIRLL